MKQYISRILGALFLAVGVTACAFADTEYIRAADLGSLPGWFLYTEDVSLLPSAEYPKMYEDDTGAAGELLLKNNTLSCHDAQLTSLQSLAIIQSLMKINDVAKAYFPRNNLVDVTPLAVYNSTLRALWLSDNTLTELPRGLELLTQLEKLCLDTNQLTSLAGIEALV
ncbi:MAG: hypothetical protein WCJ17_01480, partial [bacterium]